MNISPINSISFGKLYINKTDENRFNLKTFENKGEYILDMYDAFSKIDCATGDRPVVLNLFRAKIPLSNTKTVNGWQFLISDKNTGEILSESVARRDEKRKSAYKSALNKLVKDLRSDVYEWGLKDIDALIDKFN